MSRIRNGFNNPGFRRRMQNVSGGRGTSRRNAIQRPIRPKIPMRRKPGFYGGGGSSNIVQTAARIMNSGGWNLMDIHSCVSCGGIVNGGDGTLSDCFNCRNYLNA